tara:strand:+ start:87 stop:473 length:387 start_codon:yes stop_codon:yes gene_type:complete
MAHYAFLDDNNIVTQVITGKDEGGDTNWEEYYETLHSQTCKRTSYNTIANTHTNEGTPFRGNYAGVGYTYDTDNDVFYEPQPYASWTISEETNWLWTSPVPYPDDGNAYKWNEEAYQADNTEGWELIE